MTHAANNHKVTTVDAFGNEVVVTKRDAEPVPKRTKRPRDECNGGVHPTAEPASGNRGSHEQVPPWTPTIPKASSAKRRRLARGRACDEEGAILQRYMDELGERLTSSSSQQAGASWLEQVHLRVRQRLGIVTPTAT